MVQGRFAIAASTIKCSFGKSLQAMRRAVTVLARNAQEIMTAIVNAVASSNGLLIAHIDTRMQPVLIGEKSLAYGLSLIHI